MEKYTLKIYHFKYANSSKKKKREKPSLSEVSVIFKKESDAIKSLLTLFIILRSLQNLIIMYVE